MIIEPNVSKLLKTPNMESRYTLVVAAAKRARELAWADAKLDKTVSMAVQEIADGKIHIIPTIGKTPVIKLKPIQIQEALKNSAAMKNKASNGDFIKSMFR